MENSCAQPRRKAGAFFFLDAPCNSGIVFLYGRNSVIRKTFVDPRAVLGASTMGRPRRVGRHATGCNDPFYRRESILGLSLMGAK